MNRPQASDPYLPPDLFSITMEKIKVAVQTRLTLEGLHTVANNLQGTVFENMISDDMLFSLRSYVFGMGKERQSVSYPATWWDHVKLRWAPMWFRKRWPVEYETKTFTTFKSVCPHINVADTSTHIRFMRAHGLDGYVEQGPTGAPEAGRVQPGPLASPMPPPPRPPHTPLPRDFCG